MKETRDKLLRLSLQFFGESGDPEEKDDDFDDEDDTFGFGKLFQDDEDDDFGDEE